MAENENPMWARRRRISGQTLEKRKVSGTPDEWQRIDLLAEKADTSVSELVVSAVLAPDSRLSAPEARALQAELMALRNTLCELVTVVKDEGQSAADPEFLGKAKAASDQVFNAIEGLVR